jgi:predicted nucleic acid-binding Zn ribbon protein
MDRRDKNRAGAVMGLGEALRRAIAELGISDQLDDHRALLAWPEVAREVVGDSLAEKTRATALRAGELSIAVGQDALRHRLLFERERIRERINERVGRNVVHSVRFGR